MKLWFKTITVTIHVKAFCIITKLTLLAYIWYALSKRKCERVNMFTKSKQQTVKKPINICTWCQFTVKVSVRHVYILSKKK